MPQRVIAYIDGFNLYYGLRSRGWKRYYWLNLQRLPTLLLKPNQALVHTKYFTSVVNTPLDKKKRQQAYLDALGTLSCFSVFHGHFLDDHVTCRHCGHTHLTHHEKMTDVNIAVEMLSDAFQNAYDVALLVTADGDLTGLLRALRRLYPAKRFIVVFPPSRHSNALQAEAHACLHITSNLLSRSLLPAQVTTASGIVLQCPAEWH